MMYSILLVAHITVLGYWLGSELVINSTYRFICFRDDLPFAARDAMTDHLMDVDQHVRYALILQLTLGTMLMAQLGLLPAEMFAVAILAGALWLALVEAAHRLRKTPTGTTLAKLDRLLRYGVMLGLATAFVLGGGALPNWLRWKLLAFAGLMGCGVIIRFWLIRHFRVWAEMAANGPTPAQNTIIKRTYWQATATLALLWLFILCAALLAVLKP